MKYNYLHDFAGWVYNDSIIYQGKPAGVPLYAAKATERTSMKRKIFIAAVLAMALGLTACTSESTSSTNVNISTTTDEGTKEFSYSTENNNGEVTTESSVTETPAEDTDTAGEEGSVEASDAMMTLIDELDSNLTANWDTEEGDGHDISYDEDWVYVHTWDSNASSIDSIDEAEFRDTIIPSWVDATTAWRQDFDGAGLENVGITFQCVTEQEGDVIFTIENGEVTYFVLDEQ